MLDEGIVARVAAHQNDLGLGGDDLSRMRACDWLSTRSQEVTSSRKGPKSEKINLPPAESQKKLSVDDQLFRAVADYTYDWESWHGTDGRLIWVNPAVERATGYSVAECLD